MAELQANMNNSFNKNRAYIDAANLDRACKEMGWQIDYTKFRVWLRDKYKIELAAIFIGLIPKYAAMYERMQRAGFIVVHKEVIYDSTGKAKGNCDADLVVAAMRDFYEAGDGKTLLISSDGDYASLIRFLQEKNALLGILSPANSDKCSILLKRTQAKITYLSEQRVLLEHKKAPDEDEHRKGLFRSE
jgi:uncharacterized LabA/DUF88 family protein